MSFDAMLPIKVIRKPQEVNPQEVRPQGGDKDVERIMDVRLGLELGLDQMQMQDPASVRKLHIIREAAKQEAGAEDAEVLLWQIRNMKGKVGMPGMGQNRLDQIFQYATLLLDRSLIQSSLGSMEKASSGSPSSMRTGMSTPSSKSDRSSQPIVVNLNLGAAQ